MKKKIVSICLVICLIAIAVVGGSLAYFTDTDAKTNTFTMGKVDITLDEPQYAGDPTTGELHVFPGMTYTKDPTITVADDSEDCYLVATVTITDLPALTRLYSGTNVQQDWGLSLAGTGGLVSGGVASYAATTTTSGNLVGTMMNDGTADVAFITYVEDWQNDTITYTYYFQKVYAKTESEVLFTEVTIPQMIDNGDIADSTLGVTVNAYAIQAEGFADVYEAYAAYTAQEG